MSLIKNKQPGETLTLPNSPENPLSCQDKMNQAGKTSKRKPAQQAAKSGSLIVPTGPRRSFLTQRCQSRCADLASGIQLQQEVPFRKLLFKVGSKLSSPAETSGQLQGTIRKPCLSPSLSTNIQKFSVRKMSSIPSISTSKNQAEAY